MSENHGVGGSIPPLGTILKNQDKLTFLRALFECLGGGW